MAGGRGRSSKAERRGKGRERRKRRDPPEKRRSKGDAGSVGVSN